MLDPERYPLKKIVGFDDAIIQAIEDWRARQRPVPKLPEAVRLLVEIGLVSPPPAVRNGKRAKVKASDLAGEAIDWLSDKSVSVDEQATRKRRLIKGPSEFREMRDDLSKSKG